MIVPMTQLEVLGRRSALDGTLALLQRLRAVEVAPAAVAAVEAVEAVPTSPPPSATVEGGADAPSEAIVELERLQRRALHLLQLAARAGEPPADPLLPAPGEPEPRPDEVRRLLDDLDAAVAGPVALREHLRAEADALPGTTASLSALLPLVPDLAALSDAELAAVSVSTIALVLDDPDGRVVAQLREQLVEALGRRHLLVVGVHGSTASALLVLPSADVAEVEALLGRDRIARAAVPDQYVGGSLQSTVATLQARLAALPADLAGADQEITAALAPAVPRLRVAAGSVAAQLERARAARAADTGPRTFALRLWVPRPRVGEVRDALAAPAGAPLGPREPLGPLVVDEVRARDRRGTPPVQLRTLPLFRPFQRLVGFLSWPRATGLDPTGLMAVVLPLLFGIMVGDIGYGLLLVLAGWLLVRRLGTRSAAAADVGRVLVAGGWWSVVWGALFGELFGDLGRYAFGLPALWFYRGGPEALTPLLLFVLGVGAAHILLGLVLGLWQAVRDRHVGHVLERVGTLLVLVGLFVVAGAAADLLPSGLMTPAIAACVVGIVLASVVHGALGVLLGPLELIGTLGNVLSYLRLAAVGLASVYLAIVANELARQAPLVLGILVAVFFHALNLALAAFSPMVQALRLHYVEFFGKFYDGGGRPFVPLGSDLPEPAQPEERHPPALPEQRGDPLPPVPAGAARP